MNQIKINYKMNYKNIIIILPKLNNLQYNHKLNQNNKNNHPKSHNRMFYKLTPKYKKKKKNNNKYNKYLILLPRNYKNYNNYRMNCKNYRMPVLSLNKLLMSCWKKLLTILMYYHKNNKIWRFNRLFKECFQMKNRRMNFKMLKMLTLRKNKPDNKPVKMFFQIYENQEYYLMIWQIMAMKLRKKNKNIF